MMLLNARTGPTEVIPRASITFEDRGRRVGAFLPHGNPLSQPVRLSFHIWNAAGFYKYWHFVHVL